VIRGIILKGVGVEILYQQVIALAVFGVGIMLLAAGRFQKRLE
jgi:ABC-2 type transport system permease protein